MNKIIINKIINNKKKNKLFFYNQDNILIGRLLFGEGEIFKNFTKKDVNKYINDNYKNKIFKVYNDQTKQYFNVELMKDYKLIIQ